MVSIFSLVLIVAFVLFYLAQRPTATDTQKRWYRVIGWTALGLALVQFGYYFYIVS